MDIDFDIQHFIFRADIDVSINVKLAFLKRWKTGVKQQN